MTTRTADLFVRSAAGLPVALVEIYNAQNFSREVMPELKQDLFDYYGRVFDGYVPYFLLLSQDFGFLWKEQDYRNGPTIEFTTRPIIARYWPDFNPHERLRERELDMLVYLWLLNLATPSDALQEPEKQLVDTGFLQMMQGAKIFLGERV